VQAALPSRGALSSAGDPAAEIALPATAKARAPKLRASLGACRTRRRRTPRAHEAAVGVRSGERRTSWPLEVAFAQAAPLEAESSEFESMS
jgi:hypothetical protein